MVDFQTAHHFLLAFETGCWSSLRVQSLALRLHSWAWAKNVNQLDGVSIPELKMSTNLKIDGAELRPAGHTRRAEGEGPWVGRPLLPSVWGWNGVQLPWQFQRPNHHGPGYENASFNQLDGVSIPELKMSTNLKMHSKSSVQNVWHNLDSGSTL